ncbi:hypothetical protein D6833_11715, partial [Candidatus Parcubacteria bacterium]
MASLSEAAQRFASRIEKDVYAAVAETAGKVIEKAQANASWSSRIPPAITLKDIEVQRGTVIATISVDLEKAPHAAAFELGSGLHATRGEKKKYPIRPKEKQVLKFPFTLTYPPRERKLAGAEGIGGYWNVLGVLAREGSVSGNMYWHYVEHPGVEPRPFLRPAAEEGMQILIEKLRERIEAGFKVSF